MKYWLTLGMFLSTTLAVSFGTLAQEATVAATSPLTIYHAELMPIEHSDPQQWRLTVHLMNESDAPIRILAIKTPDNKPVRFYKEGKITDASGQSRSVRVAWDETVVLAAGKAHTLAGSFESTTIFVKKPQTLPFKILLEGAPEQTMEVSWEKRKKK